MKRLSYFRCIFLVVRPSCGTKVNAICHDQGQISRSHSRKKKKKKKKKKKTSAFTVELQAFIFHMHIPCGYSILLQGHISRSRYDKKWPL